MLIGRQVQALYRNALNQLNDCFRNFSRPFAFAVDSYFLLLYSLKPLLNLTEFDRRQKETKVTINCNLKKTATIGNFTSKTGEPFSRRQMTYWPIKWRKKDLKLEFIPVKLYEKEKKNSKKKKKKKKKMVGNVKKKMKSKKKKKK